MLISGEGGVIGREKQKIRYVWAVDVAVDVAVGNIPELLKL